MMNEEIKVKRKQNPREKANLFSIATFIFALPAFIQGWKKELGQSDIYKTIPEHKSCVLGDKLEKLWKKEVNKCQKTKKKPSLCVPLLKAFWVENFTLGLMLMIVEVIVRPVQCILIGRLISFYSTSANLETSKGEVYLYGAGVAFCSLLVTIFLHPYILGCYNVGLKIKIACSALVYRKLLKLKINAFEGSSSGKILTLVTNDSNRFLQIPLTFHYIWTGVLQTIIITSLLYQEFGVSTIFGICFLLLFVPIYVILGKVSRTLRLKTVTRTDDRVRIMKEVISGIQVIKMYTWEKYFSNLVSFYRRLEMRSVKFSSYIKGSLTTFYLFVQRTSTFITLLAYVLLGNNINAEKAFKLVCFYAAFRNTMIFFFPRAVTLLSESVVPLNRLSSFLLSEEVSSKVENHNIEQTVVCIENVSVTKDEKTGSKFLSDINLQIKRNDKIAITGGVGSGKTSLLNVILRELNVASGKIFISGSMSYAPQEPWIFNGNIRQNILFSNKMEEERYNSVLNACSLKRDLETLPDHDLTIVGDHGISLSGGQKTRINLARAIYNNADLYILDDPFSAVDSCVGKAIFEQCIKSFLQQKTVILVTHQTQYLQTADKIFVLDAGAIVAQGTFSELVLQSFYFEKILLETEQELTIDETLLSVSNATCKKFLVSDVKDKPKEKDEEMTSGAVSIDVYKSYFTVGSPNISILWTFLLFIITQIFASGADYFIAYWINLEQTKTLRFNETYVDLSIDVCIYIYSSTILGIVAFAIATIISVHNLCIRSSIKLHTSMLHSVINAPLTFFYVNQSGRILNRFFKDLETIDEELPIIINDCFQLALSTVGAIIVVAIINYLIIVPAGVSAVLLYFLRRFYLQTSRSLKRLDATTRSPVLGHINNTFRGLSTIRAFDAQTVLLNEFNNHHNLNSSAFYMYIATSRAFGYYVDLISNAFNASAIFLLLATGDIFGGNIGLTISQCLGLIGIFQFMVRQYSEMENCMTSVERVLEYKAIEPERENEDVMLESPSESWPKNGVISFDKVLFRYLSNGLPILKCISFTINSKEKIGIVGRTGAGKSSLVNALFRLSEMTGTIKIDGIDIKQLPLHYMRSKISIIPQQPIIFSGSVRKNLDPFSEFTDSVLWKALDSVELKPVISNLLSGLNTEIIEGGLNLSVGQRQLMCLARAILKNNKILVLDEATANVDLQTDALIQKAVKIHFAKCTVLTIAHRLDTIIDSDKILVMEDGKIIEFDHPYVLLQNTSGAFYNMMQQLERSTAELLKTTAKKNYNNYISKSNVER